MLFWDVMQTWLVAPCRRFRTNYRLNLHGSRSSRRMSFLECLTLEGGADRLPRNVGNYLLMLRDIPEEWKILFAPPRKSEIKHNGKFGDARFVTAVVTQNFGNIDFAYWYPSKVFVRAWLSQSAAKSKLCETTWSWQMKHHTLQKTN